MLYYFAVLKCESILVGFSSGFRVSIYLTGLWDFGVHRQGRHEGRWSQQGKDQVRLCWCPSAVPLFLAGDQLLVFFLTSSWNVTTFCSGRINLMRIDLSFYVLAIYRLWQAPDPSLDLRGYIQLVALKGCHEFCIAFSFPCSETVGCSSIVSVWVWNLLSNTSCILTGS